MVSSRIPLHPANLYVLREIDDSSGFPSARNLLILMLGGFEHQNIFFPRGEGDAVLLLQLPDELLVILGNIEIVVDLELVVPRLQSGNIENIILGGGEGIPLRSEDLNAFGDEGIGFIERGIDVSGVDVS